MGSKGIFLPIRGMIMTLKKKRMKNLSHFTYFKEKFILQMFGLMHFLNNLLKIHGFRNPFPKFLGFRGTHGTHANAATVSEVVLPSMLYAIMAYVVVEAGAHF